MFFQALCQSLWYMIRNQLLVAYEAGTWDGTQGWIEVRCWSASGMMIGSPTLMPE
jgi:hypothetical protein